MKLEIINFVYLIYQCQFKVGVKISFYWSVDREWKSEEKKRIEKKGIKTDFEVIKVGDGSWGMKIIIIMIGVKMNDKCLFTVWSQFDGNAFHDQLYQWVSVLSPICVFRWYKNSMKRSWVESG